MKASLTIKMDNDSFVNLPLDELARIFRDLAGRLEHGWDNPIALDSNGNKVGRLLITRTRSNKK